MEERAPGVFKAQLLSSVGKGLAGKAAGDDVHLVFIGRKIHTVNILADDIPMGSIVPQCLTAGFVDLHIGQGFDARLLQTQRQTARAGKKFNGGNLILTYFHLPTS